jgi:hypothetical protein
MKRLFRYTTVEILMAVCLVGLVARSLYPTVSLAVSSFVHSIPRDL